MLGVFFFLFMLSVLEVSMQHPSIFGSYSLHGFQIFILDVLQLFHLVHKICCIQMTFTCVSLCWEMSVLSCFAGSGLGNVQINCSICVNVLLTWSQLTFNFMKFILCSYMSMFHCLYWVMINSNLNKATRLMFDVPSWPYKLPDT